MILAAILALQDPDVLLRQLSSENAAVRDEATAQLQALDPDSTALDAKIEAVAGSADLEVAARARRIVSHRRLARQVEDWDRLLSELNSGNHNLRRRAVGVLVRLDREAIPFLAPMVDDDDDGVVQPVVYRLAELGDPACAEPLRAVLRSGSSACYYSRGEALRGLAALGDGAARELTFAVLGRLAENPDGFTQVVTDPTTDPRLVEPAIAAAAGPFRGDAALAAFKRVFPTAPESFAAAILRGIEDWDEGLAAMRPLVLERLAEPTPRWLALSADVVARMDPRERIGEIRVLASNAHYSVAACLLLGRFRDAESIPLLLRVVKYGAVDLNQPRSELASLAAAWALGEIAAEDSVPSLLDLWKLKGEAHVPNGSHSVLPGILSTLGRIGDARALPALRGALDDPEEEIRYAAAESLGRIANRDSVRPLMRRLDDVIGFPLRADEPSGYLAAHWPRSSANPSLPTGAPIVRSDATVREAVLDALESIVGTTFDGTPAEQAAAWRAWWKEHADDYP